MRWYEYKMEADDLHAPDDLKAKLLAMADTLPEEEKNRPMMKVPEPVQKVQTVQDAPKKKKLIHFPRIPRKQLGALAACLAVCVIGYGALSTGSLDIGAKSSNGTAGYAAASTAAGQSAMRAVVDAPEAAMYDSSADMGSSNGVATLSAEDAASAEGSSTTSKIIYTTNVTLESKDYDAARTALDSALSDADGYLESSNEYTSDDSARSVSLTLRVPQENYDRFLDAVAEAGNVVYKSQQADDVTTQYMDVEARLANLEAQRTRLQELQSQAETLSDLLEIESNLNDVQYQIESWQSQMNWYSDQVESCTVYVTLNEVQTYSTGNEGLLAQIGSAFAEGWTAFLNGVRQLVISLIYVWPVVVVAAVAAGILLWRRRRKHSKS